MLPLHLPSCRFIAGRFDSPAAGMPPLHLPSCRFIAGRFDRAVCTRLSYQPKRGTIAPRRMRDAKHHPQGHPMKIKKAVITAAGRKQRTLPLQTLIDRIRWRSRCSTYSSTRWCGRASGDLRCGAARRRSGLRRGGRRPCREVKLRAAGRFAGYGHAIYCALLHRHDPFLHLVGDHLYVSRDDESCAQQLVEVAEAMTARCLRCSHG